jgi:urease accessory protein
MVMAARWVTIMAMPPWPPMPMAEATDRLRLVQMLSPAFPIGSFAYSQGLEVAIADGAVTDAATLREWVSDVLRFGTGRIDAALIAMAHRDYAVTDTLSDLAYAYSGSAGRARELREQGRAFSALVAGITGTPQPDLPYPVAVGHAARSLSVTTGEVLSLWLMALAGQLVSVAVRFVPLGQTEGQVVLASLVPLAASLAVDLDAATSDDLSATTPGADLAAMRHETLDVRIFRT